MLFSCHNNSLLNDIGNTYLTERVNGRDLFKKAAAVAVLVVNEGKETDTQRNDTVNR
jgi:hypothetical protein